MNAPMPSLQGVNDEHQSKKPYQMPQLKCYGKLSELTQASSGPCALDGTQGFCIMLNMAMQA